MLQFFVVFLKCTLQKGLEGFQHLLHLITSSIETRRRFIVVIIEIKQACPRHCASYELSNRMTLVGDDDNMGSME